MEEKLPNFVIEDTSWSRFGKFIYTYYTGIIVITIGMPILFFIVFPLFWEGYIQLFFTLGSILFLFLLVGIGDWALIYCVNNIYREIKPIQKTKLSISNGELKIYIQNKLYLQILLNEIEKIEFVKQRWDLPRKINLISPGFCDEILLFLFIFKRKKQDLVFEYLKQVAESLNIKLIEKKEKFIDYDKIEKIRKDIKNFIIKQAKL